MKNVNNQTDTADTAGNISISVLERLPEIKNTITELIEIRTNEIAELTNAQQFCEDIMNFSVNFEFYKAAVAVHSGIKVSIKSAKENLAICSKAKESLTEDVLSQNIVSAMNNQCFNHVVTISKSNRNLANEISVYIQNHNFHQEALSVANECSIKSSSVAIAFSKAENLTKLFNEKIRELVVILTQNQLKHQVISCNVDANVANTENEVITASNSSSCKSSDVRTPTERFMDKRDYKRQWLIGLISLPAVIIFMYSLLFCKSMYFSESEFSIVSSSTEKVFSVSPQSLLTGSSGNNLYVATAFIKSIDMFKAIDMELNLKEHYSHGDFFSSLSDSATLQEIKEYWNNVVNVNLETESDLLKLSVRSYSPEFSLKIQQSILKQLDLLINRMNETAHNDSIQLAMKEVQQAEEEVKNTAYELKQFRDSNTFIDPEAEISGISNIIGSLEKQLAETRTLLDQKRTYFKEDSIEIKTLKAKIQALTNQIAETRDRIGNERNDRKILSSALSQFEQLNLKHEFAKKKLESAINSLEVARQEALTKTRYLVMIDSPSMPDESLWPQPIKAAFITFLLTLFGAGTVSLLVSAIREHLGV